MIVRNISSKITKYRKWKENTVFHGDATWIVNVRKTKIIFSNGFVAKIFGLIGNPPPDLLVATG
jgi:hypothetical protein